MEIPENIQSKAVHEVIIVCTERIEQLHSNSANVVSRQKRVYTCCLVVVSVDVVEGIIFIFSSAPDQSHKTCIRTRPHYMHTYVVRSDT